MMRPDILIFLRKGPTKKSRGSLDRMCKDQQSSKFFDWMVMLCELWKISILLATWLFSLIFQLFYFSALIWSPIETTLAGFFQKLIPESSNINIDSADIKSKLTLLSIHGPEGSLM